MTGSVWGLALGMRLQNLMLGLRMGAAAAAAVLLGPLIVVIVLQMPDAFTPLVLGANAAFWLYVFYGSRPPDRDGYYRRVK